MQPSRKSRAKARAVSEVRKELRLSLLASRGPICQHPDCSEPWSEMHEVLTRGRGGDPTDESNILCLCARCHRHITVNPEEAESLGLMRSMTAEEHQRRYRPWESA
jgi:hypothetical protein